MIFGQSLKENTVVVQLYWFCCEQGADWCNKGMDCYKSELATPQSLPVGILTDIPNIIMVVLLSMASTFPFVTTQKSQFICLYNLLINFSVRNKLLLLCTAIKMIQKSPCHSTLVKFLVDLAGCHVEWRTVTVRLRQQQRGGGHALNSIFITCRTRT